jgi:hypothetical protein
LQLTAEAERQRKGNSAYTKRWEIRERKNKDLEDKKRKKIGDIKNGLIEKKNPK